MQPTNKRIWTAAVHGALQIQNAHLPHVDGLMASSMHPVCRNMDRAPSAACLATHSTVTTTTRPATYVAGYALTAIAA